MRAERGFTVVEATITLALIAFLTSIAAVSGTGFLRSARISMATSQLVDELARARAQSVANYAVWRVDFSVPAGESVVTEYATATCEMPRTRQNPPPPPGQADCRQASPAWQAPVFHALAAPGVVLYPTTGQVWATFDYTGRNLEVADLEILVCASATDAAGTPVCRAEGPKKRIRVRANSGVVDVIAVP